MINNPRLTRKILFQEGKTLEDISTKDEKDEKPKKKPIAPLKNELLPKPQNGGSLEERTKNLYEWLSTHELINLNKLCEKCGIDRANFVKGVASNKVIKQETIEKFGNALKSYGYGG